MSLQPQLARLRAAVAGAVNRLQQAAHGPAAAAPATPTWHMRAWQFLQQHPWVPLGMALTYVLLFFCWPGLLVSRWMWVFIIVSFPAIAYIGLLMESTAPKPIKRGMGTMVGSTLLLFLVLALIRSASGPSIVATTPAPPPVQTAQTLPDSQCQAVWQPLTITATPQTFNPGGVCTYRLQHPQGDIYIRRASWTGDKTPYGPYHDQGPQGFTQMPDNAETIWSANGKPFDALVRLTTSSGTTTFNKQEGGGVIAGVELGIFAKRN